jgi:hypothetical protein
MQMDEYNDIMIDLETLGLIPGCAIVSIGAVPFNEFGVSGEDFYRTIHVKDWEVPGLTEDGLRKEEPTIKWWQEQSPEARVVFENAHYSTRRAIAELGLYLNSMGNPRVWGNGADFDNPIISVAAQIVGLSPMELWRSYNSRCYRTVKQQFLDIKLVRSGTHHNALDDARAQAAHMVGICQTRGWKLA